MKNSVVIIFVVVKMDSGISKEDFFFAIKTKFRWIIIYILYFEKNMKKGYKQDKKLRSQNVSKTVLLKNSRENVKTFWFQPYGSHILHGKSAPRWNGRSKLCMFEAEWTNNQALGICERALYIHQEIFPDVKYCYNQTAHWGEPGTWWKRPSWACDCSRLRRWSRRQLCSPHSGTSGTSLIYPEQE